jgi:hypothetical protein
MARHSDVPAVRCDLIPSGRQGSGGNMAACIFRYVSTCSMLPTWECSLLLPSLSVTHKSTVKKGCDVMV